MSKALPVGFIDDRWWLFSVTWYFLLSWGSETPVCTNIKPRHCSGLWYSSRLQVTYVQRAPASLSCSQTFPSCRSSEFEVTQPFVIWGAGPFPAALVKAGIKLGAMHTLRGLEELQKSGGSYKTLLKSCPSASPALKQRVLSGFKALLIPSPHFSSYSCKGSG